MTKTVTMTDKQYEDYLQYLTTAPNIQDVKKPNKKEFGEDNKHPTIKPVKLMEWLIKLTTNEGDVVLDCFNGSGTTGVACKQLNRNYIGIDLSQEYLDTTELRLSKAIEGSSINRSITEDTNAATNNNTSETGKE